MSTPLTKIIHEITPLSRRDCFYIVERYKTELRIRFTLMKSLNLIMSRKQWVSSVLWETTPK